jgi:alpha,alpha-trehalase
MKYLFNEWGEVSGKIKKVGRLVLLLDYDGTVTPIVEKPELAQLSEEMREVIRELSLRNTVCIISGRSLADLKGLVGLDTIIYSGNHGMELYGLDSEPPIDTAPIKPLIHQIYEECRTNLEDIPGVVVEDKGISASVHYRLVPQDKVSTLKGRVVAILEPYLNEIKLGYGKKVIEIRPRIEWGKGKVVIHILDRVPNKTLPIYIGDDLTDEDAFEALANKGITILVSASERDSKAQYFLKNVEDVKRFLAILSGHLPGDKYSAKFINVNTPK